MPRLKQKAPTHSRRLTISTKHRRRYKSLRYQIVPELRLCGDWLAEAGFGTGDTVQVEVYKKELRIKLKR